MNPNANNDLFVFNLPSEFVPEHIEKKYKIFLENYKKPYNSILDYLNSNILDINIPGLNVPTVSQKALRGKEIKHRGSISPYDLFNKDITVTFKMVDFMINYYIIQDCILNHYQSSSAPNLPEVNVIILDENRVGLLKTYYREVLVTSLSEIRLAYNDKSVNEKQFVMSMTYNSVDTELLLRYGNDTTDGKLIDEYSKQIRKNT